MSKLTDIVTATETELENQETQTIEEIGGVYYCERLENNKLCGIITTSTVLATERGWLANMVRIEDVEESEKDHHLYLKGYAPKKTESMILIEKYQSEIVELKKYLSDTDYKAIKFAEGELSEEAYREDKSQRHDARVRINELESLIEELSSK